jgi:hypothetical protein
MMQIAMTCPLICANIENYIDFPIDRKEKVDTNEIFHNTFRTFAILYLKKIQHDNKYTQREHVAI